MLASSGRGMPVRVGRKACQVRLWFGQGCDGAGLRQCRVKAGLCWFCHMDKVSRCCRMDKVCWF